MIQLQPIRLAADTKHVLLVEPIATRGGTKPTWITPEILQYARQQLQNSRCADRYGHVDLKLSPPPDAAITNEILAEFQTPEQFAEWIITFTQEGRQFKIRRTGYGMYLANAKYTGAYIRHTGRVKPETPNERASRLARELFNTKPKEQPVDLSGPCPKCSDAGYCLDDTGVESVYGQKFKTLSATSCDCSKGRQINYDRLVRFERKEAERRGAPWIPAHRPSNAWPMQPPPPRPPSPVTGSRAMPATANSTASIGRAGGEAGAATAHGVVENKLSPNSASLESQRHAIQSDQIDFEAHKWAQRSDFEDGSTREPVGSVNSVNVTWSRCSSCGGIGRTADGYCACDLGRDLRKVESRNREGGASRGD